MQSINPIRLDYGTSRHSRRKWVRRVLASAAALTLGYVAYQQVPRIEQHVLALKQQRRCLTFHMPADRVVYGTYRSGSEQLELLGPRSHLEPFIASGSDAALFTAKEWREFGVPQVGTLYGLGTVFLHSRHNPSGQERLVVVQVAFRGAVKLQAASNNAVVSATVFKPGTWRSSLSPVWPTDDGKGGWVDGWTRHPAMYRRRFRLFAGQPDVADPTHFTIPYESNVDGKGGAEVGVLHGWLCNDDAPGGPVYFEWRPTPR